MTFGVQLSRISTLLGGPSDSRTATVLLSMIFKTGNLQSSNIPMPGRSRAFSAFAPGIRSDVQTSGAFRGLNKRASTYSPPQKRPGRLPEILE